MNHKKNIEIPKLILIDPNEELIAELVKGFDSYDDVTIVHGKFEDLEAFDCMVSAANSFGLMDGGVDYHIIEFFGAQLQDEVQKRIINEYRGEQPVGTSMIVETGNAQHPYIAHTPTMRTPMPITRTDNIYNSMFAMLLAVENHNKTSDDQISSIACTGLGTATGRVEYAEAARQMELAYRNFKNPPKKINWDYASQRQKDIIFGGDLFHKF